jgi:hypothetical protein
MENSCQCHRLIFRDDKFFCVLCGIVWHTPLSELIRSETLTAASWRQRPWPRV